MIPLLKGSLDLYDSPALCELARSFINQLLSEPGGETQSFIFFNPYSIEEKHFISPKTTVLQLLKSRLVDIFSFIQISSARCKIT